MGSRLCENSDVQLACRISVSISSMRKPIAPTTSVEGRQLRKQFCASLARSRFHTASVKNGSRDFAAGCLLCPGERTSSGLSRHVRKVPIPDSCAAARSAARRSPQRAHARQRHAPEVKNQPGSPALLRPSAKRAKSSDRSNGVRFFKLESRKQGSHSSARVMARCAASIRPANALLAADMHSPKT
jgi:hypothetical protein